MIYEGKPGQVIYGAPIGILLMESSIPFIPGDVGNATTYPFPVVYQVIPGLTTLRMFSKDETAFEALYESAMLLQKQGVKAITGDCGYMALFQNRLARAMDVPVFLSSLLQVPFILKCLNPDKKVGILCANGKALTGELLEIAGITDPARVAVYGMEKHPHFYDVIYEETCVLDSERMTAEILTGVKTLLEENPDVRAILMECSDMPPYSCAVQKATGLPVFDFITMIRHVHSGVAQVPYAGSF